MMINCKRAAELICQSLDRPLSLWERFQLRLHLWMCAGCKGFKKQSEALDRLLRMRFHDLAQGDIEPQLDGMPEEVCDRLKQKLRAAIEDDTSSN